MKKRLLIVKHRFTGELFTATLGTEFNPNWYSCRPLKHYCGPSIAFAPSEVVEVGLTA